MKGSLVGCVVARSDLSPVAGASVSASGPISNGDLERGADDPSALACIGTLSDEAGTFRLDALDAGLWRVDVHDSAGRALAHLTVDIYDDAVSEVTVEVATPGQVSYPAQPALPIGSPKAQRTGGIRGRVVMRDSRQPIADVAVSIVEGPARAPDLSPLTDAAGAFSLDDLMAGEWWLRAFAPDGSSGEAVVQVVGGQSVDAMLELTRPHGPAVPCTHN